MYIVSIMAAAIISVLYSYLFYKKKIGTGEKLKIQYNKKVMVVYGIVTILTIIFIIVRLCFGEVLTFTSKITILLSRRRDGAIIQ